MIWEKKQTDEQVFQLGWLPTLAKLVDFGDLSPKSWMMKIGEQEIKGWEGNSHVHSLVNRDVARTTADGNPQIGGLVGQSPQTWREICWI